MNYVCFSSFLPQSPHLKWAALRIKLYLDIKHDTYKCNTWKMFTMTTSKAAGLRMQTSQLTTHKNPHWWRTRMKTQWWSWTCCGSGCQPQGSAPHTQRKSALLYPHEEANFLIWHSRVSHLNCPKLRVQAQLDRCLFQRSKKTGKISRDVCLPLLGSLIHLFPTPQEAGPLWSYTEHRS